MNTSSTEQSAADTTHPDLACCTPFSGQAIDESAADELAGVLRSIADPVRLRLVSIVANADAGEVCACDLPALVDRNQATVSHHLSLLVDAGILAREQRGKWAWFSLCPERLTTLSDLIAPRPAGGTHPRRPNVLFLCVHNAGRSQMAAGWLRHLAGDRVGVYSGGSTPGDSLNPAAVSVMAEVGIDITDQRPQKWTNEIASAADVIVSMGCGDECPVFPGQRREDWPLDDPAGQPVDVVRRIRDEIRDRVQALIDELDTGNE